MPQSPATSTKTSCLDLCGHVAPPRSSFLCSSTPLGLRAANWFYFKDKGLIFFFLKAFFFLEFPGRGGRKQRWLL